ncbi:putative Major facilitator superfamily transporter [Aspergillus mulundensis]|uniref:Putative Major facilitator superfamily transporter n=1 Tax=Aspergillus mulundensis TaxID=1810919 RepID=A0A3D8SL97_9EURO|nr:putative Major facilitator superfamily transporter [Aspergillus mulundensis]RDW87083.1 putative Major facilitator superfamily transporter [Aspergillus mulundensis]
MQDKTPIETHVTATADASPIRPKTRWERIEAVIWDGGYRSREEKELVRTLDIFIMSWATYGYFIRLLDSGNITNAYVSGMKEDLNFHGNQYNLLTTFFTCGYLIGQIPSQFLLTRIRPSYYIPTVELLWSIITFCFASVQNVKTVFALRFLVGMLESPFAVGVLTIMGSWYTPKELSKRIAIFYSASYAASMFSGYLQAGIYRGMDGHLGLPGWRWLFIFCGVISVPAALYGFFAVPDNPYNCRARWLSKEKLQHATQRMEEIDRRKPTGLSWKKMRRIATHWPLYIMVLALIFHCIATQPLNYFAVWLKSLDRFSVYQVNLFPTAAQACGLVTTLAYSWISDALGGKRWQLLCVPAIINLVGMVILAVGPNYGATFLGYMLNAASWGYWPVLYAWASEICHKDAEERAIVIGVAQTFGQAFVAWVPLLILDTGKYAPKFTMGYSVMSGISVLQFGIIFVIRWFARREERLDALTSGNEEQGDAGMAPGLGPEGAAAEIAAR